MRKSESIKLRYHIETAVQTLTDSEALEALVLHPEWDADTDYLADYKVRRGGRLWRCIQAHTSQIGWEPENAASLWTEIC